MNHIKKMLQILSTSEKRNLIFVFIGVLGMGLLEVLSLGSVLPFLAVAANPDLVFSNEYLNYFYVYFNFQSVNSFLFMLGVGTLLFIVFSNLAKAMVFYLKTRYTLMRLHTLSKRLLDHYLRRPYVFFLNQNTADLSKNILAEIGILINHYLFPVLDLITHIFVASLIIILLVIADPLLALMMFMFLGIIYGTIFFLVKKKLKELGIRRLSANEGRYKKVSEAMGGIKDVKVLGREHFFLKDYSRYSMVFSKAQIQNNLISDIPKYLMEIIIYGGVLLIVLFLMKTMGNFQNAVPIIGLYAFAAQRLKPSMHNIFKNISKIRSHLPVVDLIHEHLFGWEKELEDKKYNDIVPLPYNQEISLNKIKFSYPKTDKPVIENLSLVIKKKTTIGFVGSTGCGKTTLVDIILGLLEPQNGTISIDGITLTKDNMVSWRRNLGYVPQQIYLSDNSIKMNIAFGVSEEDIDMDAIEMAAEIANLHNFISEELPEKYETIVGERGVRLSGGQRQRIGIARAVYNNPEVLILDEATSALDGLTETAIMDAMHTLSHKKTIIMIAHRLTTVKECDEIIILDKGTIVDRGKYDELLLRNDRFKKMAEG